MQHWTETTIRLPPQTNQGGVDQDLLQQRSQQDNLTVADEDLSDCIVAWQASASASSPCLAALSMRSRSSARSSVLAGHSPVEAFGPVLSLNVGGMMFHATASTLLQAPYFRDILENQPGVATRPLVEGANIFVDRPGELFGHILEFLRVGQWLIFEKGLDSDFASALQDEACFYGLDEFRDCTPVWRVSEYATVWQFQNDIALYVDCHEQTIREDPDHQGLFRLCKYIGLFPLDQQTSTKRFKATSHSLQSVMTYFAIRGFSLQHVVRDCVVTHTTSAEGQHRSGSGTQYIMHRCVPVDCVDRMSAIVRNQCLIP